MGSDAPSTPTTEATIAGQEHQSAGGAASQVASSSKSSSGGNVLQIEVHVAESDVLGGVREILAVLRPHWSSSDIQFKLFTDGITNKLVGCYHRPSPSTSSPTSSSSTAANGESNGTATPQPTAPSTPTSAAAASSTEPATTADVVLVRIYGHKTDMLIDRQAETRNIQMLQRHGFAPSLYGTFQNGLAYEFVPGCTLTPATVRDARVWPLVARHMARMHRLNVPTTAEEPMLAAKTRSFLALVPERFGQPEQERRLRELGLPKCADLRSEFEQLYGRLSRLGSPVVFAHNDLLLGNVIWEERSERVAFIDYEYAAHNYQAFDIGNHFTEFAGIDEIDYARYPGEAFQREWLRVYLAAWKGVEEEEVTEVEVRRLFGQVNAFALASHFFWAVWALIQAEHSTIDFDFALFAITRYNEYLARKDEFLALTEE